MALKTMMRNFIMLMKSRWMTQEPAWLADRTENAGS